MRVFSGVQPTGNLHLGNYLGAIRNWVRLQDSYPCLFCIVDMHAITMAQNPATLRQNTRDVAAALLAAGIDAERHILFHQSAVPGHAQLAWVFNCIARLGWLNRMTQFKEKAGKNRENASVGLYTYPNLMAADILLYKATHVPVGEDQKQHLELARAIAQKFNNNYGVDLFPQPEPLIMGPTPRVMSLSDGTKKMSKSDPSDYTRLNMADDAETIALKVRKAKTDPAPLPDTLEALDARPEAANLLGLYAALADLPREKTLACHAGRQFSDFKQDLADLTVSVLTPINATLQRLRSDPGYIDSVLQRGSARANAIARSVLAEVYDIVGFLRL
ncbi:MAG: tryptophanyl-tRNA synthetase [Rhodospirillaceae bacterium]|nr:MAG: tryptophanyl-tRNA synthetase [Rhodospirillaceae bacterium]